MRLVCAVIHLPSGVVCVAPDMFAVLEIAPRRCQWWENPKGRVRWGVESLC